MATMAMAQAVPKHANFDAGGWYVIAEFWDALAILEELDRQEDLTARSFDLEVEAISHFRG